jgi:hypothetical protein
MMPAKPFEPASVALRRVLSTCHRQEIGSWFRPTNWLVETSSEPRHHSSSLGAALRPLNVRRNGGNDD